MPEMERRSDFSEFCSETSEFYEATYTEFQKWSLIALAEFSATFMLIFVTMGGELAVGTMDAMTVGLINGLGELAVIASFVHLKADFNPAHTITFVITNDVAFWPESFIRIGFQLIGGITACAILAVIYPEDSDLTEYFACLKLGERTTWIGAFFAEVWCSAIVIYVIFQSASKDTEGLQQKISASLAIPNAVGFTMVVVITMLVPVTGGSLNPARAISTAVIGHFRYGSEVWKHMEIFVLGPVIGSILVGVYVEFFLKRLRNWHDKMETVFFPRKVTVETLRSSWSLKNVIPNRRNRHNSLSEIFPPESNSSDESSPFDGSEYSTERERIYSESR